MVSLAGHRRRGLDTGVILAARQEFAQLPRFELLEPTLCKCFKVGAGSMTVMTKSFLD